MKIEAVNETSQGVTVRVSKPSMRYLDEFVRLTCAPDLLKLKLFPNVKEISETLAAFRAIRKGLGAEAFARTDITFLDVGAGHTPRTAALVACMTRWKSIAVDPELRDDRLRYNAVRNLKLFRGKVQELPIVRANFVVIAAVHAHVGLEKILQRVEAERVFMVAMPCCQPLELWRQPDKEYQDYGCLSPHRTVKVYEIGTAELNEWKRCQDVNSNIGLSLQ